MVAAAPLLSDVVGRWVPVPSVVLEIGAGIVIGPVLGWAHDDAVISFLSSMGLTVLMFLAGLEIDTTRVRGRALRQAVTGWLASLLLGIGLAIAIVGLNGFREGLIIGMAVTTTALGTLLPILRDRNELTTPFGTHVIAGAAVGELGPLIAIALLLSTGRFDHTLVVLALFVGFALGSATLAGRPRGERLGRVLDATLTTSGQLAIRLVVLFVAIMVWIAYELDL